MIRIDASNLQKALSQIVAEMGVGEFKVIVDTPADTKHGDYTTNLAMMLSKRLKKKPVEIAEEIREKLSAISNQHMFAKIEVVPPGFINFYLSKDVISKVIDQVLEEKELYGRSKTIHGKKIMVEFAHPNTHKAFHIGHLRNITTGESIVRLLEATGHDVIRTNYQGDVGMHIAKCLYAILHISGIKDEMSKIKYEKGIKVKVDFLGKAYAAGSAAYEESDEAKKEIGTINKKIYAKDPEVYAVYEETRKWSLDYFASIYVRVGSHFDRYYFESETYELGKANVLKGLEKGMFENSEGAIIFPGEKFGLHNRVFITSEGNATYEGKDMGLGPLQFKEYNPELIIHVVGPEQASYFQVVFEALAQLLPETRGKEYHLVYGWVKLKRGKMSSRSGNVVLGEWLIDEAKEEIFSILKNSESEYMPEEQEQIAEKTAISAVKYSFLKVSTKQEIAFDLLESVNFQGDSGPYLQYTYARAMSILRKSEELSVGNSQLVEEKLEKEEILLLRQIYKFPEVVVEAAVQYAPNTIAKYLFDLASIFNTFYNKHSILSAANSEIINSRLAMTQATAQVLQNGLYLLGIETLERM